MPSIIAVTDSFEPIEELARIDCYDLHTPLIRTEWQHWKQKWTITLITDSIKVLLCIACTLPVTVCKNERSNKNIKNLSSITMSSQRLSALAMMKNYKGNKQIH